MESKRINMTNEILTIKVTKIGKSWHARLRENGLLIDECICYCKQDINYICRWMLRWYDKLGGVSPMATASRKRGYGRPVGRIDYHILG